MKTKMKSHELYFHICVNRQGVHPMIFKTWASVVHHVRFAPLTRICWQRQTLAECRQDKRYYAYLLTVRVVDQHKDEQRKVELVNEPAPSELGTCKLPSDLQESTEAWTLLHSPYIIAETWTSSTTSLAEQVNSFASWWAISASPMSRLALCWIKQILDLELCAWLVGLSQLCKSMQKRGASFESLSKTKWTITRMGQELYCAIVCEKSSWIQTKYIVTCFLTRFCYTHKLNYV